MRAPRSWSGHSSRSTRGDRRRRGCTDYFIDYLAAACWPGGFAGGDDAEGTGSGFSGGDAANPASGGGGTDDSSTGTKVADASVGSSSGSSSSQGSDASIQSSPRDARAPDAASAGNPDSSDSLDAVRQACVDHINMYRATLKLAPLARASASVEACSDQGAMHDATTNMAHSSAGMCPGTGAQDTCPDLPVGGFSGATLMSSLMQCLDQMWAEGPPPSGTTVAQCIQDYSGCFLKHGHYINMSDSYMMQTGVSCGFYQMSNGDYWGNQDFLP